MKVLLLKNQKGFSLLLMVLIFLGVSLVAYGAISIGIKLQQGGKGAETNASMTDIRDALKTYYRGHTDLPLPSSVPVSDLGLNNKNKYDAWGQEFAFAFDIKNAWNSENKADILGLTVDGETVAGVLVSGGPDQTIDSFDFSAYQTYLNNVETDPLNNPPPLTYPDTDNGYSLNDDIILPINVIEEAKEIALEQMDNIRRKMWAFAISNPRTSPRSTFWDDYGLPASYAYDPWGNRYGLGSDGITATDGSFLPALTKLDADGNAPEPIPMASSGFDEGTGNSIDMGGAGAFTGEIVGASWNTTTTVGDSTSSLEFDGSNDYVLVGAGTDFDFERTDTFSITLWVMFDSNADGVDPEILVSKIKTNQNRGYMLGRDKAGYITLSLINNDDNQVVVRGSTALAAGVWKHVVATYDGSSSDSGIKIYIDGVAETLVNVADTTLSNTIRNTKQLQLSGYLNASEQLLYPFSGLLDSVAIYNIELSQGNVAAIYTGIPFSGLTLWLRADTGVLNTSDAAAANGEDVKTWQDQSDNSNDAIQATISPAYQPTYVTNIINSKPAIHFDGTYSAGDFMDIDSFTGLDSKSGATVIAVLQPTTPATLDNGVAVVATNTALDMASFPRVQHYHEEWLTGGHDDVWWTTSGNIVDYNTTVVYSSVFNANLAAENRVKLWINGVSKTVTEGGNSGDPGTTTGSVDKVRIGDHWAAAKLQIDKLFEGYITEIIVYNRALSDSERDDVENYLDTKYSVVPGKVLHLKAGTGVTKNASGDAAVNGDSVYKWTDQSGKDNNAFQATTSPDYQPTYVTNIINSKPAIQFDGTYSAGDFMDIDSFTGLDSKSGATVIAILQPTTPATLDNGVAVMATNSGETIGSFPRVQHYDVEWLTGGLDDKWWTTSGDIVDYNTTVVYSSVFDGSLAAASRVKLWINGESKTVTSGNGTPSATTGSVNKIRIGDHFASPTKIQIDKLFEGYIAEIIVYNHALTDTEREDKEDELASDYGVTITR